jgi:hypothetical protein
MYKNMPDPDSEKICLAPQQCTRGSEIKKKNTDIAFFQATRQKAETGSCFTPDAKEYSNENEKEAYTVSNISLYLPYLT